MYEEHLRHQASSVTLPDPYANYVQYGPLGGAGMVSNAPSRMGGQVCQIVIHLFSADVQ